MFFLEEVNSVDRSEKPVRIWANLIGADTEEAKSRRLNEWKSIAQLQQYRAAFVQELEALSKGGTSFTEEDILEKLGMTENMFSLEEDQIERYIRQRQKEVTPTLSTIESIRNILTTTQFADEDKAEFENALRENQASVEEIQGEIKIAERLKRLSRTLLNRCLKETADLIVALPEDRRLKPVIMDESTRTSIEAFGLDPDKIFIDTVELTDGDRFSHTRKTRAPHIPFSDIRLAVEDFLPAAQTEQTIEKAMPPSPTTAPTQQTEILKTLNKIEMDLEIEAAQDLAENFKIYKDNPDLEKLVILNFKQPIARTARLINQHLEQGLRNEQTLELIEHRRALMACSKQFDNLHTAENNLKQVKEAFGLKGDEYVLAAQDDYVSPLDDENLDDLESLKLHDKFAPEELKERAKTLWDFAHTDETATLKAYLYSSITNDLKEAQEVVDLRREKGEDVTHIEKFIVHAQVSAKIAKRRMEDWDKANPEAEFQPAPTKGLLGRIGTSLSSLTSAFTNAVSAVKEFIAPKRLSFGVLGASAIAAAIWGTTSATPDINENFALATKTSTSATSRAAEQKIALVSASAQDVRPTEGTVYASAQTVTDNPKDIMHGDYTLAQAKAMLGAESIAPKGTPVIIKKSIEPMKAEFVQAATSADVEGITNAGISNSERSNACNFVHPNGGDGLQSCLNIALK
ncbi:MAG: hypothetical protein RBR86_03745 [Pseudobdellovibrionaceae bacterium]|jgi:hypothetical protein|nr:hypothetical protein [Pseudobdellovibrionaceae bacterium]